MLNSEQAQKAQKLYKQTLLRLGEMLKILKQNDNSRNRELLRGHCDYLSALGKKQNLFGWVDLMETAKVAIVEPDNDYQKTTKLIIKEIKNAGERLIKNDINSITASEELYSLAPQKRARLNDIQTLFNHEENGDNIPNSEDFSSSATLDRDLWIDPTAIKITPNENNVEEESPFVFEEEAIDVEEAIFDLSETDEVLSEWLDDNFDDEDEDESEQISGVFVNNQDLSVANQEETDDDIISLFNESDGEQLTIDQWENSNAEELIEDEDESEDDIEAIEGQWDSILQDSDIQSTSVGIDDPNFVAEELSDIFDELVENDEQESLIADIENNSVTEEPVSQGKESNDLDIDVLDDLFAGVDKDTVIIDDREEELQGIINSLDDLDIEDDFPSTGSVDTFQILKPIKPKENKIFFYCDWDEIDEIVNSTTSWMEIDLTHELEAIVENNEFKYYEDQTELEKVVNSSSQDQNQVNWRELEGLLNIKQSEVAPEKTTFVSSVGEEKEEDQLSDLDQLLKQANKASKKDSKWKGGQTPAGQQSINQKTRVFEQSMRVPVKQLDSLNNLIGEMVVRRNRLEEDQDKLRQFLDNLLSQVQNLSDVSSRMQDLYERSLLEGALMDSRRRNQSVVKAQLARGDSKNTNHSRLSASDFYTNTGANTGNGDSSGNGAPELDELELDRFTGFHLLSQEIIELIVKVKESASDIQFLVDETDQLGRNLREVTTQLQEGINKSRMVPFAQNADRLPLPIRKIAESYDKRVQLKLEGREVLIDKMILEHIWDPLLQITKNSVTHGIELPAEREALGKPAQGTITVRAFLQGQQTVISVSDDGGGIDPQKIRKKAIQNKLLTPAEAQSLKPQDIYDFLFNAGFTTKEKADSHAGRGVGLDIVRTKLNEIRGIVSIDSVPGQGSTFTIRLPLTVTVGKALCCLNDNTRIAFPMDAIEDTKDFSANEIKVNAQGQKCIRWNNELLPFRPLSTLLRYNRQITRSIVYTSNTEKETIPIIILRGGNNLLAIQVDQVLGQEEIVIKQISGPLPKPKGISGATVRSDGIVMPIGDVIELIEIASGNLSLDMSLDLPEFANRQDQETRSAANVQPLVLIVDDSITVREMLSISFSKSGYRVEQARDGQEAWQKLRSGLPCDLVFCDIEMPRMNGLELLQHMQEETSLNHIPVAILSSRGAEKHQVIAADLGASAYLVKPYVEKDLIDSATRMINGEVLLAGSSKKPTPRRQTQITSTTKTTQNNQNVGERRAKGSRMVLIIDDSVVVREMLSMTFKKAGYQVEQARDGQEAWDKVSKGLPCDLLLCDIEMPRMNGLELLAKMQQDDNLSKLPVAMVTSRGAEKHRKIASDLGAKGYFTKPYLEEELLNAAKQLIDGEVLL